MADKDFKTIDEQSRFFVHEAFPSKRKPKQRIFCCGTIIAVSAAGPRSLLKALHQRPEPDHPFRDGLGSGSLCSDKKVKNLLRLRWEPSWNSK